jgi:antitoxin VapB
MPPRRSAASPTEATPARRRAKVFWTGRSQAIRLPQEFRFSTPEVWLVRDGRRVVVEAMEIVRDAQGWPLAFWELAGAAPDFEVGTRPAVHERRDPLSRRRR